MFVLFTSFLILTLITTRILTQILHNKEEANKNTLTGYIRKKTSLDVHHIHFGFIILIMLFLFDFGLFYETIFYAISISLILDQIFPLLKICCYFSKLGIFLAISNYIIAILIYYLISSNTIAGIGL